MLKLFLKLGMNVSDFICNSLFCVSISCMNYRYEALYAKMLPESMLGETFLEKYADHNDPVTVIDPKRNYGITAPARHPIYENFRVKVWNQSQSIFDS